MSGDRREMRAMNSKSHFEKLAELRLNDALFLFQNGRASSAYYLAGYAIELAFKVVIAKGFHSGVIPDKSHVNAIYTHNLVELLNVSGLRPEFDEAVKSDPRLSVCWGIVCNWSEISRYDIHDAVTAGTLIAAINDPNGVFQWLKKHW
jgi:hypothetical protein